MIKASIITVCFNSSKTILDCINSVNMQTYKNIEHVFIDSLSTDETVKIIKKSCKKNTEKSFGVENVDLVPSLQQTIQNPANLIEGEANRGWIRGGIPSREITRDNDYFQRKYR